MMYSAFDGGNYYVIPGSPDQAWEAYKLLALNNTDHLRAKIGYGSDDFIVAIVGSEFSYSGFWLEQAFVLQALVQVHSDLASSNSQLKDCILMGNSSSNYKMAVELPADGDSALQNPIISPIVEFTYPVGHWVVADGFVGIINKYHQHIQLVIGSASLAVLISEFFSKSLNARDLTALFGAHPIGQAQCSLY